MHIFVTKEELADVDIDGSNQLIYYLKCVMIKIEMQVNLGWLF
jgi:hypothetical protein